MKPLFKIEFVDKNIDPSIFYNDCIDISYTDNIGLAVDTLDINISNIQQKLNFDLEGKKIKLSLAKDHTYAFKGEFIIDECTFKGFPNKANIKARSFNFKSQIHEKIDKLWLTSIKNIMEEMAIKYNLEPKISNEFNFQIKRQQKVADGKFITKLANDYNAFCNIKHNKLIFYKYISNLGFQTFDIAINQINSYNLSKVAKQDYSAVSCKYYTSLEKTETSTLKTGTGKHVKKLDTIYANKNIAKDITKFKLERIKQNNKKLNLDISFPNPMLSAGDKLKINFKPIEGLWQIQSIKFNISNSSGLKASVSTTKFMKDV